MKKIICSLIICLFLFQASYSKEPKIEPKLQPPPIEEMLVYVYLFSLDSKGLFSFKEILRKVNFAWGNMDEEYGKETPTVGYCAYKLFGFKNLIKIDIKYWKKASEIRRRNLIHHELGHCLMHLGHSAPDGTWLDWIRRKFIEWGIIKKSRIYLEDACPISLMHPYLVGEWCTAKHNKYYIKELFDRYRKGFNFQRKRP